jgi:hypothetical protein
VRQIRGGSVERLAWLRRLLVRPLPLRERAPPQFNNKEWVRGLALPLTRPSFLKLMRCLLPQGGEGAAMCAEVAAAQSSGSTRTIEAP